MTIPIRPGPWSFLANIGGAVGGYIEGKERERQNKRREEQEDRAEAARMLGWLFDNASGPDKTIKAEALTGPAARELMKRAGVLDFVSGNLRAQPQELIEEGQADVINQIIGGSQVDVPVFGQPVAPAQSVRVPGARTAAGERLLSTGRIPTQTELAEDAEKRLGATARGSAIVRGGAAGRAVAGVPSEQVAVAREEAFEDQLYNDVAGRTVDASITQLKIPRLAPNNVAAVSNEAWRLAQADAKSRGYTLNEEFTKPYIDAAIQQRLRAQQELDIRRMAAAQQAAGQDPRKFLYDYYQTQQNRINDQLKLLPDIDITKTAIATSIEDRARKEGRSIQSVLADPKTPGLSRATYEEVKTAQNKRRELEAELTAYRDNIGQILGGAVNAPDPNAVPAPSSRRGGPVGFATPPMPGAPQAVQSTTAQGGGDLMARKAARFSQLANQELAKPAAQRRSQADIQAQVEREIR